MDGPFLLVPDKVDEVVPAMQPGTFALGYVADKNFVVVLIGRSDTDLNAELKDWVFRKSDCIFFKYKLAQTAKEAFDKECTCYHDFGPDELKNDKHPERMENTDWKCMRCGIYF
jgi:hypothetical protein